MSSQLNKLKAAGGAVAQRAVVSLVRAYQVALGPWLGGHCRFYPSCSEYAIEAVREHGAWRGVALAARRLSRCHPLHRGGVDLVPARKES